MSLNLIKLCVGCDSVEDLEEWIAFRLDERRRAGEPLEHFHTTRMVPTRAAELVDGGSLYWVIKGVIQVRQRLLELLIAHPLGRDAGRLVGRVVAARSDEIVIELTCTGSMSTALTAAAPSLAAAIARIPEPQP